MRNAPIHTCRMADPVRTGSGPQSDGDHGFLTVTDDRLELRFEAPGGPRPLYVDFVNGPLGYARRVNRFGSLFDAIGFRRGRPTVFDVTAGLGADAFRLAYHGCRVTAIERSEIVFKLLEDGLRRALGVPEVQVQLQDRLTLVHADARDILRQLAPHEGTPIRDSLAGARVSRTTASRSRLPATAAPDVVYIDPMYPPRKKSALAKIELRILRQIVGDDPDAPELFRLARAVARQRVVVKRPRHAEPLGPSPSHSHDDQSTRYDVYVQSG